MVRRLRISRWIISGILSVGLGATPAMAIPVIAVAGILGVAATSFVAIAVTVILNIGLSFLASKLLAPKQNQQDRQATATTLQLGENPRCALFGEVAIAGDLVDVFYYGGKYGDDWNVEIRAVADHRCDSLVGFYINDTYLAYSGDGAVPGYNGQLEIYWLPGTAAQTMPSIVTTHGPGWTAADNMGGIAGVVIAYKADSPTAKNPIWTAGRPTFLFVVKGKHCYDARLDGTVAGGSGTHRWTDPTTWEWTDNPIVCRYNWTRGIYAFDATGQPDQLLVGRGLSAIEAPPENVANYANTCDEIVPALAGATEKRYRIGALIKADDQFIDTEEAFAAACGGMIIQPYGAVEVEPGHAKAPTFWFTDDDVVAGTSAKTAAYRSESDDAWVNTVIPRYVEPRQKWADHGAPIRRVYDDVLADGKAREDSLSLIFVTSGTQAQRCGEIARRLGRLVWTGTRTLGPRFAGVEDGDWGVYTSSRYTGGQPITLRVEAYAKDEKWQNTLTFRQVASSVYDDPILAADGAVVNEQDPPEYGPPDPADWSLTGITDVGAAGSVPVLLVTGAVPSTSVVTVLFDVRPYAAGAGTEDSWSTAGAETSDVVSKKIIEAPGSSYQVSVRYQVGTTTTGRLIMGPAIPGVLSASSGARSLNTQTVAFPITSDDDSITIAAFSGVLDTGASIAFPAGSLTGLASGTAYYVFWSLSSSTYSVAASPALMQMGDSLEVFLGAQATSTGSVYPTPATPPGGHLGACPVPEAMVLLANETRDGPGNMIAAGDIEPGDHWVWSPHERDISGEWAAWPVTAKGFMRDSEIWTVHGRPDTSPSHLWATAAGWARTDRIGCFNRRGDVVSISVGEAHTYALVADDGSWLVSHNKLAQNPNI